MKTKIIIILMLIVIPFLGYGQLSTEEYPYSWNNYSMRSTDKVVTPIIQLPSLDMKAIKDEDKKNQRKDIPSRFAFPYKVSYNTSNSGIWTTTTDGGRLWQLKAEVDELKGNNILRSATSEIEATGMVDPVIAQCKLYQNSPNSFSQNTQIKFYIAENVKTAQLCIYNLQGIQIKQILVTERGESSQWISGSELSAGMYFYALIADGKEVDTKRMILTK